MKMSKTYQPQEFENSLYDKWEKNKYFHAVIDKNKEPFAIVIPPPNITGQLHMGHALNNTLQDIIIRFKRMQGFCTLWLPGTDHASIATEVKIVEALLEDGLSKCDVGREGFLAKAWEWKEKYGGRIVEQLKKLGSSCDWDREAFTMDEKCSKAVQKVFINLYNKGLIYQGDRIINWCTCCKTAISDAEVDYKQQSSFMWHIRYPLSDGSGEIVIATTRPETLLGDTAVAVHPNDERYKDMVGKTLVLPLVNKHIPIVRDEYVEQDFGSGAVKITPAHDPNDFEVGVRHNLEVVRVMNEDGTMNGYVKKYEGMDRFEARKAIEQDLLDGGYLIKKEPYEHNVGECYRCSTTIETIVSKQWFVKMQPLAQPAIDVVKKKKIRFLPDRFSKIYFNWMENIKDWCISRQLWWGHRIPAYYCNNCGKTFVSEKMPNVCDNCNNISFHQDEDVLDTWFSSALWPFSTLGYPDKTQELEYFYPTNVLITAYDIIFFWVARMIFSGLEHMDEIPFSEVLIHGIVRDDQGRKMSKSLGNGVDPLEIIEKYGADSLRFSLSNGIATGGDTRFSAEKVESCRNFINKIWNASRFVLMNIEGITIKDICKVNKTMADKWFLSRLNKAIRSITKNLEAYEIGIAGSKLYDFVWNEFCDWYIELVKPILYSDDLDKRADTMTVLVYSLTEILKLLHPYIPFVTEHIYCTLPRSEESIMISNWPKSQKKFAYYRESKQFDGVMEMIKAIRNIRAESNVAPSKRIKIMVVSEQKSIIKKCHSYIEKLAGVAEIEYITSQDVPHRASSTVTTLAEIYIPLDELVDITKEIERLSAELEKIKKEIERAEKLLTNTGFLSRAPQTLVESEKSKLAAYKDKYLKVKERIKMLK